MRVVDPPPPFLYIPVSNPWPLRDDSLVGLSVDFFSGFMDSPPPLLYSSVSNPWPLRDDSLVGLSVNFFFGFTDSLLELGDLFVVFFYFPIRSIEESSLFHMPVWSCYPFEGHRCSLSLRTLYLLQSMFKLIW
jgi:hypothetical protein